MKPRSLRWSVRALVCSLSCLGLSGAAQVPPSPSSAPRAITVDDVFEIQDVRDPQIAADGKWVAYTVATAKLKEDKSEMRVWMAPAGGGEAIVMTAEGVSSTHPRWSADGKYLAFLSKRDEGKTQVWLLNRMGGEAQRLTDAIQDVDDFAWSPDSKRLVLVLRDPSPQELDEAKTKEKSKPGSGDKDRDKDKDTASLRSRPLSLQDRHSRLPRPAPDTFICVRRGS
jgi:dipeptidyl aminopeptidase/acylaminoacyl peptidase